jgi:hypothetical protein
MVERIPRTVNCSIAELPVLVVAKQRDSDAGQCVDLEKLESLVEGVVDVDLSTGTRNHDAAGPALLALCISAGGLTHDPSGNGSLSSMAMATSLLTLSLYSA